jgi:hypothetical protein
MKAKRRIKIHINTDDVIREVEEELIQTWQDGKLDFPASPLEHYSGTSFREGARKLPRTYNQASG